jgi:HTH-type transcriptional regulator/antitoxin HipB
MITGDRISDVPEFDLPGVLRRIRRRADLSQRELATACGVSHATVAHAETGRRGMPVALLARAATLAGLRLALLDDRGVEVPGMAAGAVRDGANRLFPAHLDVRYGDEDWWHGRERYSRVQPWYTFDRVRWTRDHWRDRLGTADDHQLPRPGDSPAERKAARVLAAEVRRHMAVLRGLLTGDIRPRPDFVCTCPPRCAELDLGERPVHVTDCPCRCDVG